ncbi:hypothetical protein PR048_016352 [Dryococelus australis]|uniref:Transposase n=1 Tax=Dryococelus australis TaxID=614101 RepID=A0ABQ9HJP2_9NEOP|nr:hypothetical protein PR048_016352 [Dryococelus australis]
MQASSEDFEGASAKVAQVTKTQATPREVHVLQKSIEQLGQQMHSMRQMNSLKYQVITSCYQSRYFGKKKNSFDTSKLSKRERMLRIENLNFIDLTGHHMRKEFFIWLWEGWYPRNFGLKQEHRQFSGVIGKNQSLTNMIKKLYTHTVSIASAPINSILLGCDFVQKIPSTNQFYKAIQHCSWYTLKIVSKLATQ